jgi:hypothetical protein
MHNNLIIKTIDQSSAQVGYRSLATATVGAVALFGVQLVTVTPESDCHQTYLNHPVRCQHAEPSSQVPLPEQSRTLAATRTSTASSTAYTT